MIFRVLAILFLQIHIQAENLKFYGYEYVSEDKHYYFGVEQENEALLLFNFMKCNFYQLNSIEIESNQFQENFSSHESVSVEDGNTSSISKFDNVYSKNNNTQTKSTKVPMFIEQQSIADLDDQSNAITDNKFSDDSDNVKSLRALQSVAHDDFQRKTSSIARSSASYINDKRDSSVDSDSEFEKAKRKFEEIKQSNYNLISLENFLSNIINGNSNDLVELHITKNDLVHMIRYIKLWLREKDFDLVPAKKIPAQIFIKKQMLNGALIDCTKYYWFDEEDDELILSYTNPDLSDELDYSQEVLSSNIGSSISSECIPSNCFSRYVMPFLSVVDIPNFLGCIFQRSSNANEIEAFIFSISQFYESIAQIWSLYSVLGINLPYEEFKIDENIDIGETEFNEQFNQRLESYRRDIAFDEALHHVQIDDSLDNETDPILLIKYEKERARRALAVHINMRGKSIAEIQLELQSSWYNPWTNNYLQNIIINAQPRLYNQEIYFSQVQAFEYVQRKFEYLVDPFRFLVGMASSLDFEISSDSEKYLSRDLDSNKIDGFQSDYVSFTFNFININGKNILQIIGNKL